MSKLDSKLLKYAVEEIENFQKFLKSNKLSENNMQVNDINNELKYVKSYLQSIGPAIINNGLYPAIAFYEKSESGSLTNKYYTTRMILNVIYRSKNIDTISYDGNDTSYSPMLFNYLSENHETDEISMKKNIIDVVISLKTAIRLYI